MQSLYVGDLSPKATEAHLYSLFSAVGPVASIRICRDYNGNEGGPLENRSEGPQMGRSEDETSNCYAYVNFHRQVDAERALDTLNYHVIVDRPIRIMWSQRDPRLRKSGEGNIFVSNLSKGIDNRTLMDTFSWFGDILSCKVACDPKTGQSNGYGFVHYTNEESAQKAIEKVNGMTLHGQVVYVTKWKSKREREETNNRRDREEVNKDQFVSVYVKHLPDDWDDVKLKEVSLTFGELNSCTVQRDETGASKGFGFINFKETSSAKLAVEKLNEMTVVGPSASKRASQTAALKNHAEQMESLAAQKEREGEETDNKAEEGTPAAEMPTPSTVAEIVAEHADDVATQLYAARAQSKAERQKELREKFATLREQEANRNLYVKGLLDSVDDEQLKAVFSSVGTVQSCRVMRERNNVSKGFGFVLYETEVNAQKAIETFHTKEIHGIGGPLHVAIAKKKTRAEREAQAERRLQREQRRNNPHNPHNPHMNKRGPNMQNNRFAMNGNQNAYTNRMGGGPWVQHPYNNNMPAHMPANMPANMPGTPYGYGGPNGNWTPTSINSGFGYPSTPAGQPPTPSGSNFAGATFTAPTNGYGMPSYGRGPMAGIPSLMPGFPAMSGNPSTATSPTSIGGPPNGFGGGMALDPNGVAQIMACRSTPKEQKQLIGEKIFRIIEQKGGENFQQAGKITGMLLEMETSALINLLHQPNNLEKKIDQAADVLKQFADKPGGEGQQAAE